MSRGGAVGCHALIVVSARLTIYLSCSCMLLSKPMGGSSPPSDHHSPPCGNFTHQNLAVARASRACQHAVQCSCMEKFQ